MEVVDNQPLGGNGLSLAQPDAGLGDGRPLPRAKLDQGHHRLLAGQLGQDLGPDGLHIDELIWFPGEMFQFGVRGLPSSPGERRRPQEKCCSSFADLDRRAGLYDKAGPVLYQPGRGIETLVDEKTILGAV